MKRYILHFALLLAAAISLHAQAAPDAAELTRLLNEFLAGAGRNDAAVHDRFWAADLIYTRSAGTRTNKEDLMKGVRSAPAAKAGDPVTVYTAEDIRIQQYGSAAVVAFKLVGNTTRSDGTKSVSNHLNTGTFIKRNGKWQVVAWQATTVPNPESGTRNTAQSESMEAQSSPPANTGNVVSQPSSNTRTADSRVYIRGPRGGCYYLSSGGKKVYVDHAYCNDIMLRSARVISIRPAAEASLLPRNSDPGRFVRPRTITKNDLSWQARRVRTSARNWRAPGMVSAKNLFELFGQTFRLPFTAKLNTLEGL